MTPTTIGVEPLRIDIELYAGEEVDFTVSVLDGADAAQDVTGWTLTASATDHAGTVLHAFDLEAVESGIRVTADDTAGWADWSTPVAPWQLWITPPAGTATPLAVGWVRVR